VLSDLRESGSLEQDSDVVLFIHRPGYYKTEVEEKEKEDVTAEIIIGKQRNGPTGHVKLSFIKRYATFGELAEGYDYPETPF
jgi:replicative DNA helicase